MFAVTNPGVFYSENSNGNRGGHREQTQLQGMTPATYKRVAYVYDPDDLQAEPVRVCVSVQWNPVKRKQQTTVARQRVVLGQRAATALGVAFQTSTMIKNTRFSRLTLWEIKRMAHTIQQAKLVAKGLRVALVKTEKRESAMFCTQSRVG